MRAFFDSYGTSYVRNTHLQHENQLEKTLEIKPKIFILSNQDVSVFNSQLEKMLSKGYTISNKPYTAASDVFSVLLELPQQLQIKD